MIPANLFSNHQAVAQFSTEEVLATSTAIELYNRAYLKGRLHSIRNLLTPRSRRLLNLKNIETALTGHKLSFTRIHTIPLDRIRGSENRWKDFDNRFNPIQRHTKDRWIHVATAMQQGRGLPPVELIKVGDTYFVRDGHHRISVARALGYQDIEATVTAWSVN